MAQFIGRWKLDLNSFTNVDEFSKESGLSNEMVEMYKKMETTIEFNKAGDLWTYDTIRSIPDGKSIPKQTFKFKPGVEVDTKNAMGKGIRFTINIESDTKMTEVEYAEVMGWKRVDITREVKGDAILVTMKVATVTATCKLNKC